jgi:hypothetical protein
MSFSANGLQHFREPLIAYIQKKKKKNNSCFFSFFLSNNVQFLNITIFI